MGAMKLDLDYLIFPFEGISIWNVLYFLVFCLCIVIKLPLHNQIDKYEIVRGWAMNLDACNYICVGVVVKLIKVKRWTCMFQMNSVPSALELNAKYILSQFPF